MGIERRRAARHSIECKLVFDDGSGFLEATTIDISMSGMLVLCGELRPLGTRLSIVPIGEASGLMFECNANVVRHVPSPEGEAGVRMGLEFCEVSARDLAALASLIRELAKADPAGTATGS